MQTSSVEYVIMKKRYDHSVLNFFISIVICFVFQMSKVKTENDTTDGKSLLSPKTKDTSNDAETKSSPVESAQSSPHHHQPK